ncbi:protein D2-like [Clavelina lepadiformis]|uniref:Uncharacterized protein n=1 Tax=Clavelina lepadiformis TaxID=159417 RepID=A0ABP0FKF2_CLALP
MLTSGWTGNDLLQVEACPKELAIVKFGNVELTNICQILTPTQAQNQPEVSWTTAPEKLYSIFMMDPDAPSRQDPKYREWYHWGVLNIPGTKINEGQIIADYIGAGPPKGTGLHRYVILIYEQQTHIDYNEPKLPVNTKGRYSHKIKSFAAKFNLGSPVAGACFQAEWDDYVAKLYAKFPEEK